MSGCLIFDETLAIECAAFTKDGKKFVYGTKAYGMCVVDMDTWEECAKFLAKTPITCISISPDGKTIACGSNVGRVYMCSLEDKRAYQLDYHDPDYEVTDIAFHPSGNILVSGSADGVIVVWDVKTGRGDEPIIPMPSTSSIVSIKFESADVMWVARRDGVTISYNTSNWKKITKVEFGDELVNMFVHNNEELSPVLIAATSQKTHEKFDRRRWCGRDRLIDKAGNIRLYTQHRQFFQQKHCGIDHRIRFMHLPLGHGP